MASREKRADEADARHRRLNPSAWCQEPPHVCANNCVARKMPSGWRRICSGYFLTRKWRLKLCIIPKIPLARKACDGNLYTTPLETTSRLTSNHFDSHAQRPPPQSLPPPLCRRATLRKASGGGAGLNMTLMPTTNWESSAPHATILPLGDHGRLAKRRRRPTSGCTARPFEHAAHGPGVEGPNPALSTQRADPNC